jgi:protein-S-isoprenylcysteine O-methyltransferase Ste14
MRNIARKIFLFLMGTFIFSGFPLLAWGVRDIHGFLQNGARTCYMIMMAVLTLLVVIFVPEQGRSRGKGEKVLKRQKWAIRLLQITSLSVVLVAPYLDRKGVGVIGRETVVRTVGVGLTFFGYILMNLAVVALGGQFSTDVTIRKNHRLVTGGIYRHIRHPRYLGIVLFTSGISLVFRSWIGVVLSVATLLILIWRIRDEEGWMRRAFGKDWEAYVEKSWRLVPFVY